MTDNANDGDDPKNVTAAPSSKVDRMPYLKAVHMSTKINAELMSFSRFLQNSDVFKTLFSDLHADIELLIDDVRKANVAVLDCLENGTLGSDRGDDVIGRLVGVIDRQNAMMIRISSEMDRHGIADFSKEKVPPTLN